MENQEILFKRGFNHAYILAKYLPQLLSALIKNLKPSNIYLEGFIAGAKEFELEYERTQLKKITQIRDESRGKDRNIDRT